MSSAIPYLGVGLSYRWDLNADIVRNAAGIDWLEITPEHFLPLGEDSERRLALLARRFPLVGHSLELSLGSDGSDEPGYRDAVRRVIALANCAWHGDHLCYTRVGEQPIRALTPLPLNDDAVETAVRNIRSVAAFLERPFVVENIAYYFENPLDTMEEAEFLRRVVVEADCGLLLDLHNLHVNAKNRRFDPYRFLERLPLERVVQIHLAGGEEYDGLLIDTHASCTPDEVWSLLDHVATRCPVRGVNFEMDARFPPFARLLGELAHARAILARHGVAKTC